MTTPLLAGSYGAGTYGAGTFGVGESDAAPVDPGAPSTIPVAAQPYAVTYFPSLNGQPVDVVSVDRMDLFATPDRSGSPVTTILGPAVRTALGRYVFPAAVMPADGLYFTVVTFTAPGGAVLADGNDSLRVYAFAGSLGPATVVPLSEVKAALGMKTTADDDELSLRITEAVAEYAERVRPLTDGTLRTSGGTVILPLGITVTSVTDAHGSALTGWDHDTAAGLLYGTPYGHRNVVVTYTAGTIPANHKAAIIADVAELWSRTQRGGGTGRPSFGGGGAGDFDDVTQGRPLVLFPRIRALVGVSIG